MTRSGPLYRLAGRRQLQLSHKLDKLSKALEIAFEAGDLDQAGNLEKEMDQIARTWAAWNAVLTYTKGIGL